MAPTTIKFRLVSPESINETLVFVENHFFPCEPLATSLAVYLKTVCPNLIMNSMGRESIRKIIDNSPLTVVAHDNEKNDKIIGVSIAGISRKRDKNGSINDYYDMELSNEDFVRKLSAKHKEQTGNCYTLYT